MDAQLVEIEELAEEQITRGRESAEKVLGEDDNLILCGRGDHLVPWSSSLHEIGRASCRERV